MPGTCVHTRELWMWVPVPGPGLPLVPGGSSDGQHSLRLSTQNADLGSPPPQLVHSPHHPACSFPKHVRPVEEPAWPHNFILVPFIIRSFLPAWTSDHLLVLGSSGLNPQNLCSRDDGLQKVPSGLSGAQGLSPGLRG